MEQETKNKSIEIDQETLKDLNTTRKWTMFLAVIGYIFLGLFVILGLLAGTFLSTFKSGETLLGIPETYTLIAVPVSAIVMFFPGVYLFRYSKYMAVAVHNYDKKALNKSLKNLKKYFAYLGILVIVILILYLIAVVVAGTTTTLF
jgi:mannose/fructose/N-acetylgalactosamine-specific phosphotransferase system component IIC